MKTAILITAQFKHAFIQLRRYAFDTISMLVTLYILFLLIFLGIRTLAGGPSGGETIDAFVVGFLVWMLSVFAFGSTAQDLTQEAQLGTLEQLAMSPMGLARVQVSGFFAGLGIQFAILFGLLFGMMATTGNWLHLDLLTILPLLILTMAGIQGFGLIAGGLAVVFKRIASAMQVLQFVFVLMIAAPIDRFPWVRYLPLSWGNNLLQRAMREGTSILAMPFGDVAFLVANSLVWLTVGVAIFKMFEVAARKRALLGHY
jgi:ABC-2 type transport system permease protein